MEQTIIIWQIIISVFGVLITLASVLFAVSKQIKKERDKCATKEEVKLKFEAMHNRIHGIEKDITEHEQHNIREHDRLEKYFEKIDKRLGDSVKELNRKLDRLIEKSA